MECTDRHRPVYPVLFVLGMSHSGSTLLGRMLDMHSRILCVGELMRIKGAISKQYPCSCGKQIAECEFWSKYLPLIEKANRFQFKQFTPQFYDMLRDKSESQIIVDLSKNRVIRMLRSIRSAQKWKSNDAGFILLLRDPKGLSASMLRRTTKGLEHFLRRNKKWMKRFQKFQQKNKDRVLVVRYEDLCTEPERQMQRICRFAGMPFEHQMLFPADKTHHFIHSSTSGYMKNANKLVVDKRWHHELWPEDIQKINTVTEKVDLLKHRYSQTEG